MSDLLTPSASSIQNDYTNIPDVPVAPTTDRIDPNQVASGMTRGIQQLGSDKVYSDGGNQQIIVEDSNEPRVMMGNHATFGEGFYVSKDGTNVKTNTNPANFIFNSSQNTFKIVSSGTLNSPTLSIGAPGVGSYASGSATSLAPHGLSTVPAILAFVATGGNYYSTPYPYYFGSGTSASWATVTAQVDATNVYIYLSGITTGGSGITFAASTFSVKYYLLQETAN